MLDEESNEFVLVPFPIETIQDFEVTRSVVVPKKNQTEKNISGDGKLTLFPQVLDDEVAVARGAVGFQAALDRHEETRLLGDRARHFALLRETEVDRVPIDESAWHGLG
jgi:hypothetical protein